VQPYACVTPRKNPSAGVESESSESIRRAKREEGRTKKEERRRKNESEAKSEERRAKSEERRAKE
jgi:hypothetical protein